MTHLGFALSFKQLKQSGLIAVNHFKIIPSVDILWPTFNGKSQGIIMKARNAYLKSQQAIQCVLPTGFQPASPCLQSAQ